MVPRPICSFSGLALQYPLSLGDFCKKLYAEDSAHYGLVGAGKWRNRNLRVFLESLK
jgi:hypothetical protein